MQRAVVFRIPACVVPSVSSVPKARVNYKLHVELELCSNPRMTKDEITTWALANGWQMIDGVPSLTKPTAPHPAIVRLVLKATVVNLEIKKPAGKWDKVASQSYSKITPIRIPACPKAWIWEKSPALRC